MSDHLTAGMLKLTLEHLNRIEADALHAVMDAIDDTKGCTNPDDIRRIIKKKMVIWATNGRPQTEKTVNQLVLDAYLSEEK